MAERMAWTWKTKQYIKSYGIGDVPRKTRQSKSVERPHDVARLGKKTRNATQQKRTQRKRKTKHTDRGET